MQGAQHSYFISHWSVCRSRGAEQMNSMLASLEAKYGGGECRTPMDEPSEADFAAVGSRAASRIKEVKTGSNSTGGKGQNAAVPKRGSKFKKVGEGLE